MGDYCRRLMRSIDQTAELETEAFPPAKIKDATIIAFIVLCNMD